MRHFLLCKFAGVDIVDILEAIDLLQEVFLPKPEVFLGGGGMQAGMGFEIVGVEVGLSILQEVTP